jgi:hypothetical protein
VSSQAHLFETADMERRMQELEECVSEVRNVKKNLDRELAAFAHEYRNVLELTRADKGTDEHADEDAA